MTRCLECDARWDHEKHHLYIECPACGSDQILAELLFRCYGCGEDYKDIGHVFACVGGRSSGDQPLKRPIAIAQFDQRPAPFDWGVNVS